MNEIRYMGPDYPVSSYSAISLCVTLFLATTLTMWKVCKGSRSTFALVILGFTAGLSLTFLIYYTNSVLIFTDGSIYWRNPFV